MHVWLILWMAMAVFAEEPPADAPSPAPGPDVVEVRWHDMRPIRRAKPTVPPFAKLQRPIVCKLRYAVDETGQTTDVTPLDCPDALHKNAIKAGLKWRFEPVIVDGAPTPVEVNLILKITH